jgi:hypothetical protein
MEMAKQASNTKSGPGRKHKHGGEKTAKQKAAGSYSRGLTTWRTGKPSKGRV